ncbi:MAG: TetR/AcrR family transcriptional regulator [Oscillospiraceae bacterium]|nr:TetR/AcrR family transcriptional regulator [Oscillospiraceae bacterium]
MGKRGHANPADRRTRYTHSVIKQSLLELLRQKPFEKITVTELCKVSEINRGTFYLHYFDAVDVLDDLIADICMDTADIVDYMLYPQCQKDQYPLCMKILSTPEYHPLYLDDAASSRILAKISEDCRDRFVSHMMEHSALTEAQAEALFYFQLNGCIMVNRFTLRNHYSDWQSIQSVINQFMQEGLHQYLSEEKLG